MNFKYVDLPFPVILTRVFLQWNVHDRYLINNWYMGAGA